MSLFVLSSLLSIKNFPSFLITKRERKKNLA
jgi:hypothetical protein